MATRTLPQPKKTVTAKSVIEQGISTNRSMKVIIGQIQKKCPSAKADEAHVRFYANQMVRENRLDKEIAQDKYGCGQRGRKPIAKSPAVKKLPPAKSPTVKKPSKKKAQKRSGKK